jgi:CheY-like chemotaxis protein
MSMFKFADSVSMRLVQIFQEAIMTGVDGADLLRQVRLQPDESDPHVLTLTPDYQKQVADAFFKLEERANELQSQRDSRVTSGDNGSENN